MSLKYVDHNGAAHDIAGLSPGGNIEYGAVATRTGNAVFPAITGQSGMIEIAFSEPMPDDNYLVELEAVSGYPLASGSITIIPLFANSKTVNGFDLLIYNNTGSTIPEGLTIKYTAYKLYDVAEAEQLASAVDDIEAMIPASASSSNKFATVGDLSTETRSLDRRIDTLEDAVPIGTSISNQLINQTQLTNAIENVEIDVDDALDSTSENPVQNKVIANALQNVEIDVDSSISGTSENPVQNKVIKAALDKKEDVQFTGTKAEWDALSTAEKKEYKIANITDDVIGGEVANVVANGDMRPVTSNAVFQNSPIKIKEYVFAATTTTTEIQITETEAQDPFIVYGFVHSTNYPYNVSLPWNTEVTAFINRASQILSITITTSNYYGQAHIFVGHYE